MTAERGVLVKELLLAAVSCCAFGLGMYTEESWSAANGGLRDGGLRKSEDI